jgi:HlyD family secretion protein
MGLVSRLIRRLLVIALVLVAGSAAYLYFFPDRNGGTAEGTYRLAKTDRGEIIAAVIATGAINPTTTVIVGSQLSGQVVEILADYNSEPGRRAAQLRSDPRQARCRARRSRADPGHPARTAGPDR